MLCSVCSACKTHLCVLIFVKSTPSRLINTQKHISVRFHRRFQWCFTFLGGRLCLFPCIFPSPGYQGLLCVINSTSEHIAHKRALQAITEQVTDVTAAKTGDLKQAHTHRERKKNQLSLISGDMFMEKRASSQVILDYYHQRQALLYKNQNVLKWRL